MSRVIALAARASRRHWSDPFDLYLRHPDGEYTHIGETHTPKRTAQVVAHTLGREVYLALTTASAMRMHCIGPADLDRTTLTLEAAQ